MGISCWVDFDASQNESINSCSCKGVQSCFFEVSWGFCGYCNFFWGVGGGDIDMKLFVNLRRSSEDYCIVGVHSIKGEVNSFTKNSTWWSRVILVVYL